MAQRGDTFPLISDSSDVLEEPFWHPPLQNYKYYLLIFSTIIYQLLDQQEINKKSWKGAVNINIIQLLGTNLMQQTLHNKQSFSAPILLLR